MIVFTILLGLSTGALIGIDLGSELIKVKLIQTSIITPGRKLEMINSPHSKRLLPNAIGFSNTRLYGEDAIAFLLKNPTNVIEFNQRAFSNTFNATNRLIKEYVLNNFKENNRNSISYAIQGKIFTSEMLLAMQLDFIKTLANKTTGIEDCVITIPGFYKQNQRKNLISVAKSVKFNVLGLIHENTAAGLYYGLERFDNTPVYVIIYNIGASYIQASLVEYSTVKTSFSKLSDKKNENIRILASN